MTPTQGIRLTNNLLFLVPWRQKSEIFPKTVKQNKHPACAHQMITEWFRRKEFVTAVTGANP